MGELENTLGWGGLKKEKFVFLKRKRTLKKTTKVAVFAILCYFVLFFPSNCCHKF